MATIHPELLEKLRTKLGVGNQRVYALIAKRVAETHLPRHVAALALAADHGINTSKRKYATDEDRALLRSASRGVVAPAAPSPAPTAASPRGRGAPRRRSDAPRRKSNNVMVVHGRNMKIRDAMFSYLRALGLNPLEWGKGIKATKKGAPGVLQIVDAMFKDAAAVVVLLTPDDEARLNKKFRKPSDADYERKLTGQARLNVIFEAGRAFGSHPDTTILVQFGRHRPFSDTAGLHVIHLGNDAAARTDLADRLETAGCAVDRSGKTDWLREGDFSLN